MSALPADQEQENPLDPERILRVLPDRERETFLAQYRRAVGRRARSRWLEASAAVPAAVGREGYQREPAGLLRARARALAGTGEGMLLDDALRHFRPGG